MKPLVDSVQFFKSAILFLAKYSIVSLRRPIVDYTPTLHTKCYIVLVICCTNEISCAHRLQKIRGNIAWRYRAARPGSDFSVPIRPQVDDLYPKRVEATWAKNNRLSTSSRLLTWHTVVYLCLL